MLRKWPLVVVTLCALTGCTEPAAGAGTPEPAETADTFVSVVRGQLPEIASGRSDAELQLIAQGACAGLAAGEASDEIVDTTRALGTPDAEATDHATARELIKLAIDTTCLDQAPRVDEF